VNKINHRQIFYHDFSDNVSHFISNTKICLYFEKKSNLSKKNNEIKKWSNFTNNVYWFETNNWWV